jgi:hypothetical protein
MNMDGGMKIGVGFGEWGRGWRESWRRPGIASQPTSQPGQAVSSRHADLLSAIALEFFFYSLSFLSLGQSMDFLYHNILSMVNGDEALCVNIKTIRAAAGDW